MNTELPILDCDDCSACCMNVGHPHFWRFSADPHWQALPQALKEQVNTYIESLQEDDLGQPCIWLDLETRRCQHYEHRPQMCRDFEVGGEHCRRLRKNAGME